MDAELKELREEIRCKTLHNRSMEALILTDKFERLWDDSTKEQKQAVTLFIQFGYKSKVLDWIKNHDSLDLGERSLAFLRERGKILRIKNYSRLPKHILINEINEKEKGT